MLKDKRKIQLISVIVITILVLFIIFIISKNKNTEEVDFNSLLEKQEEIGNLEKIKEDSEIENNNKNAEKEKEEVKEIVVHITGEVKREGVIYLEKGARVIDAIKKAGGETKQADLSQVNLACELQDGQKIYIPNKNEKISQYIIDTNGHNTGSDKKDLNNETSVVKEEREKVNINTATQNELDTLPGIGPSLAQRIVEYREENGEFNSIEDIQNVKGIGDSKYEDIKEKIVV